MAGSGTQAHCTYQIHDHPVLFVEYTLYDNSYAAINELMDCYEESYRSGRYQPGAPVRMLYSININGFLPIYYLYQRANQWRESHPEYQPAHLYIAMVHADLHPIRATLIKAFSRFLKDPKMTLQHFPQDRAAAIAWLSEQK
jgi:hypothetical protein